MKNHKEGMRIGEECMKKKLWFSEEGNVGSWTKGVAILRESERLSREMTRFLKQKQMRRPILSLLLLCGLLFLLLFLLSFSAQFFCHGAIL